MCVCFLCSPGIPAEPVRVTAPLNGMVKLKDNSDVEKLSQQIVRCQFEKLSQQIVRCQSAIIICDRCVTYVRKRRGAGRERLFLPLVQREAAAFYSRAIWFDNIQE